ncbi:MAG: peptide chain release factor 2, partial [Candidatus Nealsonbacteria bacterium]
MKNIYERVEGLKSKLLILEDCLDLDKKEKKIVELEKDSQDPDFWKKQEEAAEKSQELGSLREEIREFAIFKQEVNEFGELAKESKEEESLSEMLDDLENKIGKWELQIFLSGKYDKGNAIVSIYSGAGGQDAQDWTTILLRMYERYCSFRGFQVKILHQSFGEGGGPEGRIGIKAVTLDIKGKYAFGFLKKETGVHRLVRLSPFSSKSLRHTSFALVEVLPNITKEDEEELKINPADLRVDTYRASGPGGQYVNKRDSAIRITHLPTGIVVSCQVERLQGSNKDRAMKVLLAKLHLLEEEKKNKELKKVKGDSISASWGNQIRSYVLHPYKLVKDLRTGVESTNTEKVLDGEL